MYNKKNDTYGILRQYLDQVPVISTHEHYFATTDTQPIEVLKLLANSYSRNDLLSVSPEFTEKYRALEITFENQFDENFETFMAAYDKAKHTSYFKGTLRGLKECWGLDTVTKETLSALQQRILKERSNTFYQDMMDKYKIRAKILDTCSPTKMIELSETGSVKSYSSYSRFAFPLASYHDWDWTYQSVWDMLHDLTGTDARNLDEYMALFEKHLAESVKAGVVCMKDQSAYSRILRYDKVSKEEADAVYQKVMKEETTTYEEYLLLSNWRMRFYMEMARKYKLPVQLHTGHIADLYNDVSKANAIHLVSLLEDFKDVHFDLFHGNWPYMGEYLFLGKNYPNVSLDLCWVQSIDCAYSVELMQRAVMTLPYNKVLAFGGDTDQIELTIGFLCQARDNVAEALSGLVDKQWLSMDEAKKIACDWFFNNPNEIFRLGFEKCDWQKSGNLTRRWTPLVRWCKNNN